MKLKEARERIDFLEEQVRQLQEMLIPPFDVPAEFGLRPAGRRIFQLLSQRELVTREAVIFAVTEGRDITGKNIDVQMYHLRKAIEPYGYTIQNVWGVGYKMHYEDPVTLTHPRTA